MCFFCVHGIRCCFVYFAVRQKKKPNELKTKNNVNKAKTENKIREYCKNRQQRDSFRRYSGAVRMQLFVVVVARNRVERAQTALVLCVLLLCMFLMFRFFHLFTE